MNCWEPDDRQGGDIRRVETLISHNNSNDHWRVRLEQKPEKHNPLRR